MRLLIPSLAHLWILSLSPRGAVLATPECKVVVPPTNSEFALLRVGKKALCAVKNESGSSCLTFLGDASEKNITELVLSDDLNTCEIKEPSSSSPDSCIMPPNFDDDIFNGWVEDRDEEGNEDDGGGGNVRRRLPSDTRRKLRNNGPCPFCSLEFSLPQKSCFISPGNDRRLDFKGGNEKGKRGRKLPLQGQCPFCVCSMKSISIDNEDRFVLLQVQSGDDSGVSLCYNHPS